MMLRAFSLLHIVALLSAYHIGQITQQEAINIMNTLNLSPTVQQQLQILYNNLVAGNIDRNYLDNALNLGEAKLPGFSNEQEFLEKIGLG